MQRCQETGYYDDEAPEITDAEIEEAYLESLEQDAPSPLWEAFYALDFNDLPAKRAPQYARIGNGIYVRTGRAA